MSINGAIGALNSALTTFTYAENVIAQNVANANTPGYTTEIPGLETLTNLAGVTSTSVGSARDLFLDTQLYAQLGQQGLTTAQYNVANQLAGIFPEIATPGATTGLVAALNTLTTAWTTLGANPGNAADATAVITDLQAVAAIFNADSGQLGKLLANTNAQVSAAVTQVNTLEDSILSLNQQIANLGGVQNAQTSALIDQREVDAEQLTGLTGGSVTYQSDGAMVVSIGYGPLVNGTTAFHLAYQSTGTVVGTTSVPGVPDVLYPPTAIPAGPVVVNAFLTSGTLGGLLSGSADVVAAQNALDTLANTFGLAANAGNVGTALFTPASLNPLLATSVTGASGTIAVNPLLTPAGLAAAVTATEIAADTAASAGLATFEAGASSNLAALTAAQSAANTLVAATRNLQSEQQSVNLGVQSTEAETYANAYDAAVRMQYVLEAMLNYLITQTGSSEAPPSASAA